jgi:hypothetical protein
MSHCIPVPFAASHVIFKSLGNLEYALDVFHAECALLCKRDALARFDRVFNLQNPQR